MRDQFLFKHHIVIKVYGFEGKPYKFPTFMIVRLFLTEYVMHRFLSGELHFIGFKQHRYFQIPKDIGPFQVKYLSAFQYMEGFLEHLNLENAKPTAYDPHNLISK